MLRIGDSLRQAIDKGLSKSRFGIVVLSPNFFRKKWPQRELDGLVQREVLGQKVILPIWHNVSHEDVSKYSLPLADKVAGSTSSGISQLAAQLIRAMEEKIGITSLHRQKPHSISSLPASDKMKEIMNMDWQEKKDVLLKALFDMDNRKKTRSEIPTISHEKAAGAIGISLKEMDDLEAELKEDKYIDWTSDSLHITTKGKRYIRENERDIKDVWQKHKNNKLENLGEE